MTSDSIELTCAACGSTQFIQPTDRELQPEDLITCSGCSRQATVAVLREQALEAAKKVIADSLRRLFKKQ